jgi:hypothetical protein
VRDPEVARRALLDCVRWSEQGDLEPGPVQTRPLEHAAAVLAEIAPPAQPGKTVLTIDARGTTCSSTSTPASIRRRA